MKKGNYRFTLGKRLIAAMTLLFFSGAFLGGCNQKPSVGLTENTLVRISRITVDASQLEQYKEFLTEEIKESLRIEPGVLTLFAVTDKNNPSKFTILEIYADETSYQSHIKSPHFRKYKDGTLEMVKELEIIDTAPLLPELVIKSRQD